jgi:hypothetical protein
MITSLLLLLLLLLLWYSLIDFQILKRLASLIVLSKIRRRKALCLRADQVGTVFRLIRTSANQNSSPKRNTKSSSLPGTCR